MQIEPIQLRQIHAAHEKIVRSNLGSHNQTQHPLVPHPCNRQLPHGRDPLAILAAQKLVGPVLRILLHQLDEPCPRGLIWLLPNSFGKHLHQNPGRNTLTRSW